MKDLIVSKIFEENWKHVDSISTKTFTCWKEDLEKVIFKHRQTFKYFAQTKY